MEWPIKIEKHHIEKILERYGVKQAVTQSLVAILKSKNCDKLKSFLQETYLILESNYFNIAVEYI